MTETLAYQEEFELALAQHLQPVRDLHGVTVQFMPDLPKDWAAIAEAGMVILSWVGTDMGTTDIGGAIREEIHSYSVAIMVKKLRGVGGFYQVKAHVRDLLFGYLMPNMLEELSLGAFNFAGMSESYVTAQGSFSIIMPGGASQQSEDPDLLPTLTEINFADDPIETAPPTGAIGYDDGGGGADLTDIYQG
jgi:hypothetical protein